MNRYAQRKKNAFVNFEAHTMTVSKKNNRDVMLNTCLLKMPFVP